MMSLTVLIGMQLLLGNSTECSANGEIGRVRIQSTLSNCNSAGCTGPVVHVIVDPCTQGVDWDAGDVMMTGFQIERQSQQPLVTRELEVGITKVTTTQLSGGRIDVAFKLKARWQQHVSYGSEFRFRVFLEVVVVDRANHALLTLGVGCSSDTNSCDGTASSASGTVPSGWAVRNLGMRRFFMALKGGGASNGVPVSDLFFSTDAQADTDERVRFAMKCMYFGSQTSGVTCDSDIASLISGGADVQTGPTSPRQM